jgi:hypothetical protein
MMYYYLKVQFQGQRVKQATGIEVFSSATQQSTRTLIVSPTTLQM